MKGRSIIHGASFSKKYRGILGGGDLGTRLTNSTTVENRRAVGMGLEVAGSPFLHEKLPWSSFVGKGPSIRVMTPDVTEFQY